jgi:hypothetical protein
MESRRIPASQQTAERIEGLLAAGGTHDVRSDLIRLGVRKLVEEVLEAEVGIGSAGPTTVAATGRIRAIETATDAGG